MCSTLHDTSLVWELSWLNFNTMQLLPSSVKVDKIHKFARKQPKQKSLASIKLSMIIPVPMQVKGYINAIEMHRHKDREGRQLYQMAYLSVNNTKEGKLGELSYVNALFNDMTKVTSLDLINLQKLVLKFQ